MNSLQHVAIIMDGNGRWGIKKKKSRNLGFKKNLSKFDAILLKNYEMLFKKIETIQERSFRRKKRNRIYKLGN